MMSKFKLNWSHFVIIGLGSFIVFILTLVFTAGDMGDLVTEDYYEHSLNYQEETIEASRRTQELVEKPEIKVQANGILVTFPEEMNVEKGEVKLLRGNFANEDISIPISDGASQILVPSAKLKVGEYEFSLRWNLKGKKYLIRNTVEWIAP